MKQLQQQQGQHLSVAVVVFVVVVVVVAVVAVVAVAIVAKTTPTKTPPSQKQQHHQQHQQQQQQQRIPSQECGAVDDVLDGGRFMPVLLEAYSSRLLLLLSLFLLSQWCFQLQLSATMALLLIVDHFSAFSTATDGVSL